MDPVLLQSPMLTYSRLLGLLLGFTAILVPVYLAVFGGRTARRKAKLNASQNVPSEQPTTPKRHVVGATDDDPDITRITVLSSGATTDSPNGTTDAFDEEDATSPIGSAVPIVFDGAEGDVPTSLDALILVSAAYQTDQGKLRRRNEDSYLMLDTHYVFTVADGMGGHAGGDVASRIAVETLGRAFDKNEFEGMPYPNLPRRGAELAMAIQMANAAIYEGARENRAYAGMGTTMVSARFSPNKQRVYIGHVGDSRCYRMRGNALTQVTTDHTMAAEGVSGPLGARLMRAVGIAPAVKIDVIIMHPLPDDVYLLCTDGLSKMVSDDDIRDVLAAEQNPEAAVRRLVERANERGGRDNITVILVRVEDPKGLRRSLAGA